MAQLKKVLPNTYDVKKDDKFIGMAYTKGKIYSVELYASDTAKLFTDFLDLKKFVSSI
jgi:hypothetical protein